MIKRSSLQQGEKKRKRKDGSESAVRTTASGTVHAPRNGEDGGAGEAKDELRDEQNGFPGSHPSCSVELSDQQRGENDLIKRCRQVEDDHAAFLLQVAAQQAAAMQGGICERPVMMVRY